MKKSLLLMLFLALTWSWTANADELTVYEGTTSKSDVPAYIGYFDDFTRTQTVIPASDLEDMAGGTISAIKFYTNSDNVPYTTVSTVDVYLKEVSSSSISAFEVKANCTMVYQGTLDIVAEGTGGALSITFSAPFAYNGGNLLIGIENTTDAGYKFIYFYGQTVNGASVGGYNSSSLDNVNPSQRNFIPKTTFTYTPGVAPSCSKPKNLAASEIDHEKATITWTSDESAWNIAWSTNPDFDPATASDHEDNVSTKSHTITGLNALTDYYVSVQSACDGDWSNILHFKTTAEATIVGDSWSDDFEGTTCGWELINGELTNANWAWGTATSNGGTHSLYVSKDGGATYEYNNSGYAKVFAAKLLNFTAGKYQFSYDWQCNGESSFDFLRVALVPGSQILAAGTDYSTIGSSSLPSGWIALDGGSKLNTVTSWQSESHTVNVVAGNYYLVLAWRQDNSGGTQPPAAVDNVSIIKMACPYDVADLAVSSISTTGATLTWTAGEALQWQVAYADNSSFENPIEEIVSSANKNLIGLQSASKYYVKVRAYCGNTDFGAWSGVISFATECEALDLDQVASDTLWFEKFDSYTAAAGFLPICWNRINTCSYSYYDASNYPRVYANSSYSTYAHSAPNCLYLYSYAYYYGGSTSYDPQPQYAILPEMENLAGKQITLQAKGYNATSTFKIGVMSDPADANTFTLIKEQNGLTTSYQEFTYNIPNTTTDSYVAIMIEAADEDRTTNGVYIDDIVIANPPACAKPTDLAVNASGQTATLTWVSGATEFNIARATSAAANPDENIVGTASTNSIAMNNLDLDADYYFWVQANCGSDGNSEWAGPISVHIGYCVPGPTSRDGKGITDVAFGHGVDVVNNSDANGLPNASPYYGDYKGQIGAVQVGVESTIAITTSTGSYPYTFVIWVDFDNDLTFEDDEIIYTGKCASGAGTLNANITIPASQALGDYRMRIAGADSYFNSFYNNGGELDYTKDHDPCLTGSKYAVFHDYTLRVLAAPSCLKPTELAVSNIAPSSVDLSWNANSGETEWKLFYKKANEENFTEVDNITENPYTLNGLVSATAYQFYVQAVCGASEESEASAIVSFTTACEAVTAFPWSEDFESYSAGDFAAPCWVNEHISGDGSKVFGISTTNAHGTSTKQLNLPDMSSGTMTKLVLPEMALPANYQFVLDVYRNTDFSSSADEGIRIFASEDGEIEGATELAFISRNYTQTDGNLIPAEPAAGWYTYELPIGLEGTCYIILRGESKFGSATYMDNFIVKEIPSCLKPSALQTDDITTNSAEFSWTPGASETQWQYACVTKGADPVWSNENIVSFASASVSGLNANSSYDFYVRAYCDSENQSEAIMLNFRTECGIITVTFDEPYVEDFEDPIVTTTYSQAGQMPDCWEGSPAAYNGPKILSEDDSYNYAASGQVLYFYGAGNNYAVLPKFSNPLSDLQISFKWATESSSYGTLTLGYITDEDVDYNTFKVIKAFPASSASYRQLVQENIFLDTLPASASKLVFRWYYGSQWGCNVDDIVIRLANIVDINASEYATYFNSEKAYIMPAGVTGHAFANGVLSDAVYQSADVVPAAIPLVLHGPAGSYLLASSSEAGTPLEVANDLIGVNVETEIEDESGYLFYVLSLNAANDVDSVGFYWMNATGAGGFTLPAHKAYLKYGASSAPAAFYLFNGENNATWLDNLQGVEGTVKFMHEGNIYILRDSIIYDATGRKVRELK